MSEDRGVPVQCWGVTRAGAQCKKRMQGWSGYCALHVDQQQTTGSGRILSRIVIDDAPDPAPAACIRDEMLVDLGSPDAVVRNKICIVGFTSSLHDAPWGDPEWDVIPCNNLHNQIPDLWPQATAWFNLHAWADIVVDEPHVEWLKQAPFPVFMFPEAIEAAEKDGHTFPSALAFPHREIVEKFRGQLAGARYFTNSVSWMIAFALLRILEADADDGEIALYGVDMATGGEYASQRPSCEYWLGVAEGAGIKVTVAPKADILKAAFLYGVDEGGTEFGVKMRGRIAELEQKLADANAHWESLRSQMEQTRYVQHQVAGALEDCRYWDTCWLQQSGNVRQGGADPYAESTST